MYARTLFAGEGRESGFSPLGECCRVQQLVYFGNLFSSILSIRICDRGAQFIVNCFEKIVMATNDSGFFSTYLLVNEERPERERREGREQELTGELAKRIQVKNLCGIWDLFQYCKLMLTEFCVIVWCLYLYFCTGSTKRKTADINILLLFLADLSIGSWLRNPPLDKEKSKIIVFKSKLTSPCWTMRKVLSDSSLITWWVSEMHLDR